jgi:hypothetical protein
MFIIQRLRIVGQKGRAAREGARRRKEIQANGQCDDFEGAAHKMSVIFIDFNGSECLY